MYSTVLRLSITGADEWTPHPSLSLKGRGEELYSYGAKRWRRQRM